MVHWRCVATTPLLLLLALEAGALDAQQNGPRPDPLEPLAVLVGRWQGTSEGQPGAGTVERTYARVLGGRFLRVDNRSVYPPQTANPEGEVHEDVGYFSFDRGRSRLLLRQFHVEGFVVQYLGEPASEAGKLVFVSEAIENSPAGWRTRETYRRVSGDEMEEVFEMAGPGKDFELYSRTRLKRVSGTGARPEG